MKQYASCRSRKSSSGFTLIELVIVVAVLAILAMLLVPRLAFIRTMATYANEAASIQDCEQNMLMYHATQAQWPDHFDSLLEPGGGTPTSLYGGTAGDANGLDSNLSPILSMVTLTANSFGSLKGLLGQQTNGVTTLAVMDHDQAVTTPGDSGNSPRLLAANGSVAAIATGGTATGPNASDPNAASAWVVYNSVYPTLIPLGTAVPAGGVTFSDGHTEMLIALGVGPSCLAVGKTILQPPAAYEKDSSRYNRTLILIRVRTSDTVQASLAGGLSPDGRTLEQCLGNYRVTAQR